MSKILGIDTSNYTSSLALFDTQTQSMQNVRKLLPVKNGELGLRQSDAVFHHTKQLPELFEKISEAASPDAVSVSVRPCGRDGSYFPCFLVGMNVAKAVSTVCNIPEYDFSHQQGHIAAALWSAERLDILKGDFLAFHVSGGTTEAVYCRPDDDEIFSAEIIARSLDLNAGQVIDRVGHMLSLPFPSGKMLDELAAKSEKKYKIKPFMRDGCCSLSGLQNKCEAMYKNGESAEDISLYCIKFIEAALGCMLEELLKKYGDLPVVFSGGVMSNSIIRRSFQKKYQAVFAKPEFSTDNACGLAVLGALSLEGKIK